MYYTMKTAKLFFIAGVIILVGVAFLFYKKYSNPPQKQPPGAENKVLISNVSNIMKLTSPVFENNGNIPARYTCDGENINPPLEISQVPEGAKSLVLIINDPDAPAGDWVHWTVWNISPAAKSISESSVPTGAIQGTTDFGKSGYGGPCPPSGVHHYQFKLYALDEVLNLNLSAKREDVEKVMEGHILEQVLLVGLYKR